MLSKACSYYCKLFDTRVIISDIIEGLRKKNGKSWNKGKDKRKIECRVRDVNNKTRWE